MPRTVISVENLSKKYQMGVIGTGTFYGDVRRWWARQRGRPDPYLKIGEPGPGKQENEMIWALKDVSFAIQQGEAVGIVGRNGAGKSTLLKILSLITAPTSGVVKVKGRIASLLEIGTGFHPELTGRENIYLNGAIMGMTRTEVRRRFDEIVDFAGVGEFIDTPVKRYSSGMYVRLAFAVAAHLEPDILIVDEVLAVGDVGFQQKSMGKMRKVAGEGRTVLVVTHNMTSIINLCSSAVWLDNGQVRALGDAEQTVQSYLGSNISLSTGRMTFPEPGEDKEAFIRSIELKDQDGEISTNFDISSPIKVDVNFCCRRRFVDWRIFVSVTRYDGITLFAATTWDYNKDRYPINPGNYRARLLIPGRFLAPTKYLLTVAFGEPPVKRHDAHENILRFEVTGKPLDHEHNIGLLAYPFDWQVNPITEPVGESF
jgi:lipopolysaccharide transport system ATP-binding protein